MSRWNNRKTLQLLSNGVFAVNKLKDLTSAEVLENIKKVVVTGVPSKFPLQSLKFGHGGTLDQTATGVLVIGCGLGCKVLTQLLQGNKRYLVTGCLGVSTDTFNDTGSVTGRARYDHVTREMINQTVGQFEGNIMQTPPLYSALKSGGHRLADLTRAGIDVEVKPRPVTCHTVRCVDFSPPMFKLAVSCGGGFYIRSLVSDLGRVLNTYAHVTELRRIQHGPFTEQDMLEANDWALENILVAIRQARGKYSSALKQTRRKQVDVWDDR